ncbi:MAG: homoserine kinase [Bifidobacteriaceae bacterium]|jgi:homoserine kinase|nr:homoserine kinase [Bifidobacteriaceae bacterium]
MRLTCDHVRVRVPATTANLGPGFDSLGLALDIWDEIEARAVMGPSKVVVEGEGATTVPLDDTHLVVRAARYALEAVGAPEIGFDLLCHNRIRHSQGLGSSASAVVAGALIVRGMIADPTALNAREVFEIATAFEGHPDNAAPAVFGRGTIGWLNGQVARCTRFDVHPEVRLLVALPTNTVSTKVARAVLTERVDRQDAVFNLARSALAVHALTAEPALLFEATEDRLHQEQRREVMPQTLDLIDQLRSQRIAAVVSGAGPGVLIMSVLPPAELRSLIPPQWQVLSPAVATHGGVVARLTEP